MRLERLRKRELFAVSVLAAIGLLVPLPADFRMQWLMNLAHAPLFAIWAWLGCNVLARGPVGRRDVCLRVAALGGLLALVSELLQLWIPGRWADWRDLLANLAGLSAGIGLWMWLPRWRRGD